MIVTGASSGIGKVSASAFAREGARVVIAARRADQGMQTVEEIKSAGGEALFVRTDVANAEDVINMVATTIKAYGQQFLWNCNSDNPWCQYLQYCNSFGAVMFR